MSLLKQLSDIKIGSRVASSIRFSNTVSCPNIMCVLYVYNYIHEKTIKYIVSCILIDYNKHCTGINTTEDFYNNKLSHVTISRGRRKYFYLLSITYIRPDVTNTITNLLHIIKINPESYW